MAKYWVTMTDTFMSGWGRAEGKTNKYVVECNSRKMAKQIYNAAKKRSEMKYVNICLNKPHYNPKTILTSWKKASELGELWTGGIEDKEESA